MTSISAPPRIPRWWHKMSSPAHPKIPPARLLTKHTKSQDSPPAQAVLLEDRHKDHGESVRVVGPVWTFTTGGTAPTSGGATVTGNFSCDRSQFGGYRGDHHRHKFFDRCKCQLWSVDCELRLRSSTPPRLLRLRLRMSAGTVGITVTNKAGDTGTLPSAYVYTSRQSFDSTKLNVIHPNHGSPSGGDAVIISGSNLVRG